MTAKKNFFEIVKTASGILERKYGLQLSAASGDASNKAMLANAEIVVGFFLDPRIDRVECEVGRGQQQGRAGYQYSTYRIVEFYGKGDRYDFPLCGDVATQIQTHVEILEELAGELLRGNRKEFEALHEFNRGWNKSYTRSVTNKGEMNGFAAKGGPEKITIFLIFFILMGAFAFILYCSVFSG